MGSSLIFIKTRVNLIMNFIFLVMALSFLTWAGTVSAADDCYSLDADDNTWVEVLVQKDWANELLEYLEENYGSLEKSEIWYFVEQSETYYETEEEMMEYTEFRSIALDDQDVAWFEQKISALDQFLSIKFVRTQKRSDADFIIAVHDGSNPDEYENLDMVGYVSETKDGEEYVLVLNYNIEESNYATVFYHELGHVLGLKHPFDNSDGNCIGSTEEYGDKTAHTGLTVMAYEDPPEGWEYLKFYSKVDLLALQSIFGKEN